MCGSADAETFSEGCNPNMFVNTRKGMQVKSEQQILQYLSWLTGKVLLEFLMGLWVRNYQQGAGETQ